MNLVTVLYSYANLWEYVAQIQKKPILLLSLAYWWKMHKPRAVQGLKLLVLPTLVYAWQVKCLPSLILLLSFYGDLIKYTKVKGSDFAFWMQTLMMHWNCCLNNSSLIIGWVLVMDDLHSACQMSHLREKTTSQWLRGRTRSHLHGFPLTLGWLAFVTTIT